MTTIEPSPTMKLSLYDYFAAKEFDGGINFFSYNQLFMLTTEDFSTQLFGISICAVAIIIVVIAVGVVVVVVA